VGTTDEDVRGRSPRALRACAFASPIAITSSLTVDRKSRLLIEWPKGEEEPTKYWLSTLPKNTSFLGLVDFAKLRWRSERDDQELKQEVGLGDVKGRGWRGFHHHATLRIAVYGLLISERGIIPPLDLLPPRSSRNLPFPRVADPEAPPPRPERHVPNAMVCVLMWLN
jgi:hypothetical protein